MNLAYYANGSLLSRSDPAGTTTYGYDSYEHLNSIAHPTSPATSDTFVNNARGDVVTHTNPRLFATTFQYNARRQLTNTVGPTNLTTRLAYDAAGNLQSSTDGRGNTATHFWSATSKLLGMALPAVPQGVAGITNIYNTRDWLSVSKDPLQRPRARLHPLFGALFTLHWQ